MANYDSLINAIKAAVKTNGTGAITGATLQATLLGTIEELTVGFQFMGVATPTTSPDSNDKKEFYLGFAGTYANFGSSVTVPEGSVILFKKNNGAWSSQVVKIADPVSVSQNTETGKTQINVGDSIFNIYGGTTEGDVVAVKAMLGAEIWEQGSAYIEDTILKFSNAANRVRLNVAGKVSIVINNGYELYNLVGKLNGTAVAIPTSLIIQGDEVDLSQYTDVYLVFHKTNDADIVANVDIPAVVNYGLIDTVKEFTPIVTDTQFKVNGNYKAYTNESEGQRKPFSFISGHTYKLVNGGNGCTYGVAKTLHSTSVYAWNDGEVLLANTTYEWTADDDYSILVIGYGEGGVCDFEIYDVEYGIGLVENVKLLNERANPNIINVVNQPEATYVDYNIIKGHKYKLSNYQHPCTYRVSKDGVVNAIAWNNGNVVDAYCTYYWVADDNYSKIRVGYGDGENKNFQVEDVSVFAKIEDFIGDELPILPPSPQLPANANVESDFNAETTTSMQIHSAFDELISTLTQPANDKTNFQTQYYMPKYITVHPVIGRDASNTYDIKAYVLCNRNRFAWKARDKYYAWYNSNAGTTRYTKSITPRIGDMLYVNTDGSEFGTITAYNSATQTISVGDTQFVRKRESNVDADIVWTSEIRYYENSSCYLNVYEDYKGGNVGRSSTTDGNTMTYNGKIYTRFPSMDMNTDTKATITLWANEHGPQSDPTEPSILLYRLAKDLSFGCRGNKFLQFLKKYCKIVLIPCVNPYGINKFVEDNTFDGRYNANGVNINRNYDVPGWESYTGEPKGTSAGSENETQFVMNVVDSLKSNVAIDMHCLGYTVLVSNGRTHYSGVTTDFVKKVEDVMALYGYCCSSYGSGNYNTSPDGDSWLHFMDISGGLLEMNAGNHAASYDGKQHTATTLESDYALLLNCIRMWYYGYDNTLNLSNCDIV